MATRSNPAHSLAAAPSTAEARPTGPLGAYGLRIEGLDEGAQWLQPAGPGFPLLRVHVSPGLADHRPNVLTGDLADLCMADGSRMLARRGDRVVRFTMPVVPPAAELVHPYLAPAAAVLWSWDGRMAIHGGAVITPAGAILVLGIRRAGKSTTLAAIATRGLPVLADDLVAVDEGAVLAGPRGIDLRHESTGLGDWQGQAVRASAGGRLRVALPLVPARTPAAGAVLLSWGDTLSIRPMDVNERLGLLASQRSLPVPGVEGVALLDLAALPMIELTRPAGRAGLEAAVDALVAHWS